MQSSEPFVKAITAVLCISLLSTVCLVFGQDTGAPGFQWEHEYPGALSVGNSVNYLIQTSDGGYAFLGTGGEGYFYNVTPAVWLFKVNSEGTTEWNKEFYYSDALGLVQTSDGGYVLAGQANTSSGTVLYKLDSSGNMQWNRSYPFSGCNQMISANDGGFTLAGTENSNVWLAQVGLDGQVEWNITYAAKFDRGVTRLLQTSDGSYLILGNSIINPDLEGSPATLIILKTNSAGTLLWTRNYDVNVSGWGGQSIIQTSDNDYVVVDNTNTSVVVFKLDQNGSVQWTQNYPSIGVIDSIVETSDGGLALGGINSDCNSIIRLAETDSLGNLKWSITAGNLNLVVPFAGGLFYTTVSCLIESNDGSLVLAGIADNENVYQASYYLTKTQPFLPVPSPSASLPSVPSVLPSNTPEKIQATQGSIQNPFIQAVLAAIIILGVVIAAAAIFWKRHSAGASPLV